MKKLFLLIFLVGAALLVLSACGECAHEWGMPTCTKPSTCKLCNEASGETLPHKYAAATCSSPKTCLDCGATSGEALAHTLTVATCKRSATCTVCNASVGEPLEHYYTGATCVSPAQCAYCYTKSDIYAEHEFEPASCDAPQTCVNCRTTVGSKLEHSWQGDLCLTRQYCKYCGTLGEMIEHIWTAADCYSAAQCELCREFSGEPLGHTWKEGTCLEPASCVRCDYQTTDIRFHKWEFTTCTTSTKCAYCFEESNEIPGHDMAPADCIFATICRKCGVAEGAALGHSWLDANCQRPETCARCSLTRGEKTDHIYTFSHRIEPLCNEGKIVYACTCGLEQVTFIAPTEEFHICDENGKCTKCNFNYDVTKMTLDTVTVGTATVVERQGIFRSSETVTKIYKSITSNDLGIPLVELNGSISSLTGKSSPAIQIPFVYTDGDKVIECTAELKVQGASSAGYAKKNYNVKLYEEDGSKNKVKLVDSWGKQFKYCLKANWVDYSQSRNVVSGQIYGDVIHSRDVVDELTGLANGGAIDGFPVVIYNNGVFHGLYTLNIPKDKWMFDMKDSDEKNQAILMAEHWGDSVAMREEINYNLYEEWKGSNNWEIEFVSNEESLVDSSATWVAHSFNQLIKFVMNNDGDAFRKGIHQYADVDKCIDSMLYTFFICADDNISKNVLWVTYDGVHWFSSMYDMDGTWGMQWNGNMTFKDANTHLINVLETSTNTRYNLLWQKLYLYFYNEIVARYWELRQTVFTMEHITNRFEAFFNQIPDAVRIAEKSKWSGVPSKDVDHLAQILQFAKLRIEKMDAILNYKIN